MGKAFWGFGAGFPFGNMPFGRGARFFESGEFRLAILSLLSEGPKHGYQLMKEMSERSGGVYRASAGSVYPTLQQLEDEGLIEASMQNGRRVFNLTAAGRAELARDPEAVRRIWERAEQCEDWSQWMGPGVIPVYGPLAEVMRSSLRAMHRVRKLDDGADRVRDILDRARHELDAL